MQMVAARGLPDAPLDASAAFLAAIVPSVRSALAEHDVCVAFDPADHTHLAWRRAAIQALAREAAPRRVNAVASADARAIAESIAFLARAPGVTGQYLPLDSQGAENRAG